MASVTVGHTVTNTISQLDQSGNPMLNPVAYDSPPTWSGDNASVESLVPSADGTSMVGTALAAGTDNISLQASAGGVAFSAAVQDTVNAVPQVLTSLVINQVVA